MTIQYLGRRNRALEALLVLKDVRSSVTVNPCANMIFHKAHFGIS